MKEKLEQMRAEALAALADKGLDPESLRIRFLGKKGELTALLRSMGELSPEERPAAGQAVNDLRVMIEEGIEKAKRERREAAARKKALAEEMEKRQITFF